MEDSSPAELIEKFQKRIKVLNEQMEKLKIINATLQKIQSLPRAKFTGLLNLPLEIRLQIYHYCIPRKRIVEVSGPRFHIRWSFEEDGDTRDIEEEDDTWDIEEEDDTRDIVEEDDTRDFESGPPDLSVDLWNISKNNNSLFLVSKQISKEALDILYGENIFKLYLHDEGEWLLRKIFSESNRQRMRHILAIAQPMGVSFEPGRKPDNALWSSILLNLKAFRLVAQQPLEAAGYYNAPTLEQEMDRWVKWIKPFLEFFGQHLRNPVIVEVDDDDRKETSELIKQCLPNGYRKVQCHLVGDLIFKRGQFSIESGYWDDDSPTNCRDIVSACDWDSD